MASSLLPHEYVLSAEVGRIFGAGGGGTTKAVDFYVNHDLQWMIEFLIEGRALDEHLARFAPGGRYSNIPRRDWLVVDFRVNAPAPAQVEQQTMYVVCAADFLSASIVMHGKQLQRVTFSGGIVRTVSDL